MTNDPTQKNLSLQVEGNVDNFVEITPARVRMAGQAGEDISKEVSIVPLEKYPFKIVGAKPEKEGNIRVDVTAAKDNKGYLLTIHNLKQERTRYYDTVIVQTDSKIRPELTISVYGNIADKPRANSGGQG